MCCISTHRGAFSLCHITGAMNKTDKSSLMHVLEAKGTSNTEPSQVDVHILDAMFFLRTLPELPPIFAGIAQLIFQKACEFSDAVHIVCDTYSDGPSIKGHERQERGDFQSKFQITGPSQRRPANFHTALLSSCQHPFSPSFYWAQVAPTEYRDRSPWGPMYSTKTHNFRQAVYFLQRKKTFKRASL